MSSFNHAVVINGALPDLRHLSLLFDPLINVLLNLTHSNESLLK